MSDLISIELDTRGVDLWAKGAEKAVQRAASMSGGDAIRAMKVEASRKIREAKKMKLGATNRALVVRTLGKLTWTLTAKGSVMPVSAFSPRQTKKGVSVEINVGKRVLIRGAFIARMKSGHVGVFMRRGKGRLPIKEAFTTRISEAMKDQIPGIAARGRAVFASSFNRLLPLEMAKRSA